jgi:hypothetical protein
MKGYFEVVFIKLKPLGVNFTNILREAFFVFTLQVLLAKEYSIGGKCVYKMLVKLTIAVFLRFQRKLAELTSIMDDHCKPLNKLKAEF